MEGPDFPDGIGYLWQWWQELAAGSGDGMGGGLGWRDIEAWTRLTDREIEPHEALALLEIDRAMRHPQEPEEEAATQTQGAPAWLPESKR